ncbi:hypothetical protein VB834_20310 [Limnoraphis robusta Tam1]|uniref:hypothetical protein n=1 Tax=Limnoraphis robusta TaxID=1118279 RepID=UPI002B1EC3A2|nr:hypothetical protein [Limnoraphis robusta]MEA5500567.1 hypothetical protein [Limnoraphis robusta BA-68 BA1]MEA5541374.1 hypothetical protein [Limnoraphis robusta Tam1]
MSVLSRYWLWVKVDSFGKCKIQEVEAAKAFVLEHFGKLDHSECHAQIQRQLVQWHQSKFSQLAEVCLCCFISNQIRDICLELENKFGQNHNFTSDEIFPLVLEYAPKSQAPTLHPESLYSRILQNFDPEKGTLSTWTNPVLKTDQKIKQFLLEHGIEQITDWLILNRTSPGKLQRLLSEFQRTDTEIENALQLLNSYHSVYRNQLLNQRRSASTKPYPAPTLEQLSEMAKLLSNVCEYSPEEILEQLQNLAKLLRQERIYRLTKGQVEIQKIETLVEVDFPCKIDSETEKQEDFAVAYRQQIEACLTHAVGRVIQGRITYYQGQKNTLKAQQKAQIKTDNFLKALHLFHCREISMSQIAYQLQFNDQTNVTRLLQLKALRNDIGRTTLKCLCDRVFKLAQNYVSPEQLLDLESKVQDILGEEISKIVNRHSQEVQTPLEKRKERSQLSKLICEYLDKSYNFQC